MGLDQSSSNQIADDEYDSLSDDDLYENGSIDEDLDTICPKYLIFSTGSLTYTPHQIGFKRIDKVDFPKKLDPGLPLKERIALREREKEQVSLFYYNYY